MNWWSETALVWLPIDIAAYPEHFADRAKPGTSDFFYYGLDAFDAVERWKSSQIGKAPWAYVVEDQRILSPREIDDLMPEWRKQMASTQGPEMIRAETSGIAGDGGMSSSAAAASAPTSNARDGGAPAIAENAVKFGQ